MSDSEFFKGTRLGEKSDFEKSLGLGGSEVQEEAPKPLSRINKDIPEERNPEVREEEVSQKETETVQPEIQQKIQSEIKPEVSAPAPVPPQAAAPAPVVATETPLHEGEKTAIASMQDVSTEEYSRTMKDYKIGDIIKGRVASMGRSVLVDIDYKSEGVIEPEELNPSDKLKIGDVISVVIMKLENKEGHPVLSKFRADVELAWREAYESFKTRSNIEAMCASAVQGGLVVDFQGIRGFVPASQVLKNSDEDLDGFIGKVLPLRVIEIDRKRRKIVFSHRAAAMEERQQSAHRLWDELEAGQVRDGVITNIKRFGIFVDLGGGAEGLVHVSDLSWKRIENPEDVFKAGTKVQVFILGVDKDTRKISLGIKQLQRDPWADADKKYTPGDIVSGKVTRVVSFGAFVELEDGLEGLVHISELSYEKVERAEQAVTKGDWVKAKVLRVSASEQRISLSIKGAAPVEESADFVKYREQEDKDNKEVTLGDIFTPQ